MAPNPFVLVKKAFSSASSSRDPSPSNGPERNQSIRRTEHWDAPVPGLYEYIPGRGWYLIKRDDAMADDKTQREQVLRCSILHRWILRSEQQERTRMGKAVDAKGKIAMKRFFRMDDGVAWINCWEEDGSFQPGPWERWCLDEKTGMFRKMLVGDDPEWRSRRGGSRSSQGGRSGDISRTTSNTDP